MAAIRFGLTIFNPKLITSNNELEYLVQILLYGCHFASEVALDTEIRTFREPAL